MPSQLLQHVKGNESAFTSRSQNSPRYRDAVLAAHFVVLRVRIRFLRVVFITFIVNGTFDDIFRSGGEDIEAGLHIKDLGTMIWRSKQPASMVTLRAYHRVTAVQLRFLGSQLHLRHTLPIDQHISQCRYLQKASKHTL